MKKILMRYREIIGIIWSSSKFVVISAFLASVIAGLCIPFSISVNADILNRGIDLAQGTAEWSEYIPILLAFLIVNLLPTLVGDLFIFGYIEPRTLLILRTDFKASLLGKLETLDYAHFENSNSMEIIDKAFGVGENSARHMFPMYVNWLITSVISSIGILVLLFEVKWWLIILTLVPFLLETYIRSKKNYDIYKELQTYWNKERRYTKLSGFLRKREYVYENYLNQSADYLINTYKSRVRQRNREYEQYYFKHLRHNLFGANITRIAPFVISAVFLYLYLNAQMSIGSLLSLTSAMFASVYQNLNGIGIFFRASAGHIFNFEYYDKYLGLSDTPSGEIEDLPGKFDIEFRNVYFTYPGSERQILKGLSFKVHSGEVAALIGQNGEGKTTIIKLLMGLFRPDSGEILVGGHLIEDYSIEARRRLFGAVMQDFLRVSVSLSDNIRLGDLERKDDGNQLEYVMQESGVEEFAKKLPKGEETLLGREFDGGVDVSGGQWQRIAIARALYADRPVLILDEPTNQLDPMAESRIYREFSNMSHGKTTLLISHRLGSTTIADNIIVIDGGKVVESGRHEELMAQGGLYAKMYSSQREWYVSEEGTV